MPAVPDRLASTLVGVPCEAGRGSRAMGRAGQLAIVAALALFVSPFLPWYGETVVTRGLTGPRSLHVATTGWQALSGAQVVAVLVALGVAVLLFGRARRDRPPGIGHGAAVAAAGALVAVLVLIKMIDHDGGASAVAQTTISIRWGMVVALVAGGALAWLGVRMAVSEGPGASGRQGGSGGRRTAERSAPSPDATDSARIRARERQRRREAAVGDGSAGRAHPRRDPVEPRELEHRD